MPQHDDHNDLAALDFLIPRESDDYSGAQSAALDFSVDDEGGTGSVLGALHTHAPGEPEGSGTVLGALKSEAEQEDDEDAVPLFTVMNPPRTVAVSADIGGSIERVELSSEVTNMSESQLAEEILVLANLARQKGLAGQHTYVLENELVWDIMREMGASDGEASEAISTVLVNLHGLSTPKQAEAAQEKVFATRYPHADD